MKPFDTTGEYTPEEVKAALAGIDGTRQLSFRYERLNKNNSFIESIDYITKCSIENNSLADIKRTAKFDILDTGTINYLQDRIKPYIRLAMPESASYSDYIKTLKSDVWWKMDDPDQVLVYATVRNPANGLTYNTFASAYNVLEGDVIYANIVGSNDATNRTTFWAKIDITANNPVDIYSSMDMMTYFNGVWTTWAKRTVYVQTGDTEDSLEVLPEIIDSSIPGWQAPWYDIEQVFPELKTYYFKFETVLPDAASRQVRLEWQRPRRVSDSSGNEYHGLATGTYFEFPGIVQDGGYSISNANNIQTQKKKFVTGPVFAGSVWLADATSTQLKSVFSSNYESPDNSASAEDSDCEAWIDYTAGKVALYAGFNSYQYDVRLEKSFNSAFLRKVRHFAWSVNTLEDRWFFWLDGIKHELDLATHAWGTPESDKSLIPATSRANRIEINPIQSGTAPRFDDFIWFNNAELDDSVVKKIYRLGTVAGQTRRGYVEWPQGVFVLSSPTRTMQDGNTVVRAVDGYDQLVNLKEDSFDYRYSVKAGAKYTDAVKAVLKSTVTADLIPLTSDMWSEYNGTVILSDASATLTSPTTNSYPGLSTSADATAIGGLSLSMAVSGTSDGYTLVYIRAGVRDFGFFKSAAGSLSAIVDGVNSESVTYSSVTHKYWRFRENNGFLYYETSADGLTWASLYSAPSPLKPEESVKVIVEAQRITAASTMRIDDVKFLARLNPPVNIVNSVVTLPTGMEWEPGTPKLSIINDLLGAVNYESATYDENGIFVSKPYISPARRSSEFTYATDDESVIVGDVDQTVDIFSIPNKWIVVVSDPDRPMLVGEYVNDDPHSPTSTVSRGRTIVDYRTEQNAPDQLTLDAQAARLAFEASQVYEVIEFDTALMPIHQTSDVYDLIIDGLVISSKFSETSWSMELKNGATMSHKIRKVVSV